jgi:hypothetical protein
MGANLLSTLLPVSPDTVSEGMYPTDAESRGSSVSRRCSTSAPICNLPDVLAPERAATARNSTSDPTSPTATIRSESRQPSRSKEARSCEPVYFPAVENTQQPEFEATPDVAQCTTALHTALEPDPYESDSPKPEREEESHLASANSIPLATSLTHEVEVPHAEDFGHVMQGSPANARGGGAIPEPIQQLRKRPPTTQPAKRRRRADTTHSATVTGDSEVPIYKRRKVAASGGLRSGAQPTPKPAQNPQTRASDQSTSRQSAGAGGGAGALPSDEDEAIDHVDASYQEWSLPDAVLKRRLVNGRAILQLQFTWATPRASYESPAATPTAQLSEMSSTRRGRGTSVRADKGPTSNGGTERADADDRDGEDDIHSVERILARWKRGRYFLEWTDGSTSWEPKRNILDQQMMDDFEATYRGFDAGIDVLASRTRKGRQQWRIRWHGRPAAEDRWVDGELMDPARVVKVQVSGFDIHSE